MRHHWTPPLPSSCPSSTVDSISCAFLSEGRVQEVGWFGPWSETLMARHWAHSRQKLKRWRERWVSLSLPGVVCYFYFSYDPFPTQGSQKPYLPLAAPGDPNCSLWAEPHLPHRNLLFLYVCVPFDALHLCQIATVLCLSLTSTLDINYSHKLILSKVLPERNDAYLPCISHFTRYFPLILSTSLSSLCYRWGPDLEVQTG